MTRRITISLPDDVATYAEEAGDNTSGFIADVLRRKMRADNLRAQWTQSHYVVTDEHVERTRAHFASLLPINESQRAAALEWLRQFDVNVAE
jgi:hypothetical protein